MKVAIVTSWFAAGAGYVSKAYIDILSKKHDILIYARGGKIAKGNPKWDNSNVTWGIPSNNDINIWHFKRWLIKNKIEIVIFNEQRYWKPVIIAKNIGITVGSYIDYYTQQSVSAFKIYDFLLCNTKRHYSVFNSHQNCYYIPWGTDINLYEPAKISQERPITFIISAGWQGKYDGDRRGSLLGLKAFRQVRGNCRLLVYSQVNFTDCTIEWQRLINDDERIEFRYGTYDPFPYNEGDIYLYPSKLDGIGLSLPEALSSGLPAITSNNAPMNEFVKDGYNGFLVEIEKYLGRSDGYYWAESICNLYSLAEKMQVYIDNKHLVEQHKFNAREDAIKNLDWKKNAVNLPEIVNNSVKIRTQLDINTIKYAYMLDNISAPSNLYRFINFLRYFIKSAKNLITAIQYL